MIPEHALLLVGSGKASGTSTSEALGRYLLDRLAESGIATTVLNVNRTRRQSEDERLMSTLATADLFIVATPLYVDSLPYLLTRQLEVLCAARSGASPDLKVGPTCTSTCASPDLKVGPMCTNAPCTRAHERPCRMLALVNCGFPEAAQCQTAIAILRAFARRARFEWAGGLACGEGGAIDGRRIETIGAIGRGVRTALEITAGALAIGEAVPQRAVDLLARPMMPRTVYVLMANRGWRRQAAHSHVKDRLADRPYDREGTGRR
jgi:hypothetical protein